MVADLVLNDRDILPLSGSNRFGVVVMKEEVKDLYVAGYKVRRVAQQELDEDTPYYIEVYIGAHQRDSVDLAMLETVGRADVVVSPESWTVGNRSGIKAYVKSVTIREDGPCQQCITTCVACSAVESFKKELASTKAVQAGWAFGVPEDGRDQWLDIVVNIMRKYV